MQNQAAKSKSAKPPRRAVACARDGNRTDWLLIRWRAAGQLRLAVFAFRVAATIAVGTRAAISIRAGATVAIHARTAITIRARTPVAFAGLADLVAVTRAGGAAEVTFCRTAITLALGIGPAELAVRRAATGLVEVVSRRTPDIAALAIATLAALHWALHAGARSRVGDHVAQPLDSLLGQLVTHLREGAGAGDGGLGLKLGGLHDFLTDGLLVRLVGQRGLGNFTAQAHGALAHLAHDVLLCLEEAAQGGALVVVQVTEEFLWIELRVARAALAFAGAEVTALAVHGAAFTARGVVATELLTPDAVGGPAFLAAALVGPEVATRRALAFGGTFLPGAVVARTFFTGAFLGGARAG